MIWERARAEVQAGTRGPREGVSLYGHRSPGGTGSPHLVKPWPGLSGKCCSPGCHIQAPQEGLGEGKLPLAFASVSCLFFESYAGEPLPQARCWPCPLPEGVGRGSSWFVLVHFLFSHLCDPQPDSSPPGTTGAAVIHSKRHQLSSWSVSRAAHAWRTFCLKNVLEFTTELKELKCCIKLLASTINSH